MSLNRVPARPLGMARIAVGLAAVIKGLTVTGWAASILEPGGLLVPYAPWLPPPTVPLVALVLAVWLAAAVLFAVGFRTRLAGALLVTAITVMLLLDQRFYSNHLYLLGLVCALLVVADSGAALSLDARRRAADWLPGWPVFLLKLQLTIVYGYAAVAKLNDHYLSGAVLNTFWSTTGPFALPDVARTFPVMASLSVVALLFEVVLAAGLWIHRLRPSLFVAGAGFHAAIIATMGSVPELVVFALVMFSLYLLFLDAAPRSRLVVWDDSCSFCADSVRWFRRLDWLRVHTFAGSSDTALLERHGISRAEADSALQFVDGNERLHGFDAVRAVLESLPASFLWAPVLRLPPVRTLGARAYAAVARRRSCRMTTPAAAAALSERRPALSDRQPH